MSITLGVHAKAESAFSSSVTTGTITTQASGSTLVAFGYGANAVTITDSKSNTWTAAGAQAFNSTFGNSTCAYVQNATGGASHTFTASHSGGGLQIMVLELIGAVTAGGPDAFAKANVTGSGTAVATPSITTAAANAAVVACTAGASGVNVAPTSTNGTVVDSISGVNFVTGGDSWFIKSAGGSTNDTLTFAGQGSFDMAAFTISFAPAGGGGGASDFTLLANAGNFALTGGFATSDFGLDVATGLYVLNGQQVVLATNQASSNNGSPMLMMFKGALRKR